MCWIRCPFPVHKAGWVQHWAPGPNPSVQGQCQTPGPNPGTWGWEGVALGPNPGILRGCRAPGPNPGAVEQGGGSADTRGLIWSLNQLCADDLVHDAERLNTTDFVAMGS